MLVVKVSFRPLFGREIHYILTMFRLVEMW